MAVKISITYFFSEYNTRQVGQFLVKRHRTSLKCMCISICGVKLWNSLEMSINNCKNEFLFKKEYKRMIFKKYQDIVSNNMNV